jgi:hypothetical protein
VGLIDAGGVSFTRADYSEEGSGGSLKTPEDYESVLNGLSMYPQVSRCLVKTLNVP